MRAFRQQNKLPKTIVDRRAAIRIFFKGGGKRHDADPVIDTTLKH